MLPLASNLVSASHIHEEYTATNRTVIPQDGILLAYLIHGFRISHHVNYVKIA
jgi:hypothetical protein